MSQRVAPLMVLCALVVGGCTTGSGSVRPAPGIAVIEDADGALVDVLTEVPSERFQVLGLVRASADARFESGIDEARRIATRALRDQAASVGADAVVIDEAAILDLDGGAVQGSLLSDLDGSGSNLQRPGGAAYATRPVRRVVLTGRAIRLRSVQPAQPDAGEKLRPAP